MPKYFSIIAMLVCSSCALVFGQSQKGKPEAKGEIFYEIKGDKLNLEARCENRSGQALSLSYTFEISRADTRGNTVSNSQGGKKQLAPGESKTLSSTSVSWGEGSRVRAVLKTYYQKKLLDTQVLELPAEDKADE